MRLLTMLFLVACESTPLPVAPDHDYVLGGHWPLSIESGDQVTSNELITLSEPIPDSIPGRSYVIATFVKEGLGSITTVSKGQQHQSAYSIKKADRLSVSVLNGPPSLGDELSQLYLHSEAVLLVRYFREGRELYGVQAYGPTGAQQVLVQQQSVFSIDVMRLVASTRPASDRLHFAVGDLASDVDLHVVADADLASLSLEAEQPRTHGLITPVKTRVWGTGRTAGGEVVVGVPIVWNVDGVEDLQRRADVFRYIAAGADRGNGVQPAGKHTVTAKYGAQQASLTIDGAPDDTCWHYMSGCNVAGSDVWSAWPILLALLWISGRRIYSSAAR